MFITLRCSVISHLKGLPGCILTSQMKTMISVPITDTKKIIKQLHTMLGLHYKSGIRFPYHKSIYYNDTFPIVTRLNCHILESHTGIQLVTN
jgi:uncharacterized radical SAM superfamily protein